jgi:hypothetical protein
MRELPAVYVVSAHLYSEEHALALLCLCQSVLVTDALSWCDVCV